MELEQPQPDLPAAGGELQGVADEVVDELHDPFAVEAERDRLPRHLGPERDPALLGDLGVRLDDGTHGVTQVALRHRERKDPRVDPRQVQQVRAHPLQAADLLC